MLFGILFERGNYNLWLSNMWKDSTSSSSAFLKLYELSEGHCEYHV